MKIERVVTAFEPITITLESQEDVNAFFNMAILAGEHEQAESSGTLSYAEDLAESLQAHITVDEAVSGVSDTDE